MGRVAKYKKVKKFDLYDQNINDKVNKPTKRKQKDALPHSFRRLKYQQEQLKRLQEQRSNDRNQNRNRDQKVGKTPSAPLVPKTEVPVPEGAIDQPTKANSKSQEDEETKYQQSSVVKFEGKRDDESFRQFEKRLAKQAREASSDIKTRKRARSNYLRHRKEKKREKKKNKKEEQALDNKEHRFDSFEFGSVVDRPPSLRAAPKMKKRSSSN